MPARYIFGCCISFVVIGFGVIFLVAVAPGTYEHYEAKNVLHTEYKSLRREVRNHIQFNNTLTSTCLNRVEKNAKLRVKLVKQYKSALVDLINHTIQGSDTYYTVDFIKEGLGHCHANDWREEGAFKFVDDQIAKGIEQVLLICPRVEIPGRDDDFTEMYVKCTSKSDYDYSYRATSISSIEVAAIVAGKYITKDDNISYARSVKQLRDNFRESSSVSRLKLEELSERWYKVSRNYDAHKYHFKNLIKQVLVGLALVIGGGVMALNFLKWSRVKSH